MLEQLKSALDNGNKLQAQSLISAISDQQTSPHAQISLVNICLKQGFFDLGVRCFAKAANEESVALQAIPLAQEPAMQKNTELAIAFLHSAHVAQPKNLSIIVALADLLLAADLPERVEVLLKDALSILPHAEIVARLAEAYFRLGQFHDAKACATLGVELTPNNPQAYINLAVIEKALTNLPEAARQFSQALQLDADNFFAHINLSHLSLMGGQFELGWNEYEWRWQDANCKREQLPLPLWQGEQESAHHLLLWADQGIGDQIMFLSLIQRLDCRITLKIDIRLAPLLSNNIELIPHDYSGDYSEFDSHISLGSLGGHFIKNFDDFTPARAYLTCPISSKDLDREAIKRIGFSWRGGRFATAGGHRSLSLDIWNSLLAAKPVQWVNLQYDTTEQERQWLDSLGVVTPEIDLTADIVGLSNELLQLDGYIGVDNSTAHLAGALGVNTTLLLPAVADWRWFTETEHCYWYDSVKLSRLLPVNAGNQALFIEAIDRSIDRL